MLQAATGIRRGDQAALGSPPEPHTILTPCGWCDCCPAWARLPRAQRVARGRTRSASNRPPPCPLPTSTRRRSVRAALRACERGQHRTQHIERRCERWGRRGTCNRTRDAPGVIVMTTDAALRFGHDAAQDTQPAVHHSERGGLMGGIGAFLFCGWDPGLLVDGGMGAWADWMAGRAQHYWGPFEGGVWGAKSARGLSVVGFGFGLRAEG